LWALLSAVVCLGCIAASTRRLIWAVAPQRVDPRLLLREFDARGREGFRRVTASLARSPEVAAKSGLWAALSADGAEREALVSEELLELRIAAERWVRVPRVCANISLRSGFFFATLALVDNLSARPEAGAGAGLGTLVAPALDAFAVGLVGMSYSVAVHSSARRAVRDHLAAVQRLVDRVCA
jgi:hypothetical protein